MKGCKSVKQTSCMSTVTAYFEIPMHTIYFCFFWRTVEFQLTISLSLTVALCGDNGMHFVKTEDTR